MRNILEFGGLSVNKYNTEQRKLLLELFQDSEHQTFSAQDIQILLKDKEVSMSSIYRNLAEMEREGLVCKVNEKNRPGALYQYVDPHHCAGVIHFKCQSCEATYHLDKNISQMIMGIAKDMHGFMVNESGAFLYGECDKCSQKAKEKI